MAKRLSYCPNSTVPPPPRFDEAATAAARPVERLPQHRFAWVYENIRLAPSHWKLLVVTAMVSLTTGGVGGMLIKDGQQSLGNEAALNSIPGASQTIGSTENVESTGGMIEPSPAEVTPSPEVQPRRRHTRLRRASRLPLVEVADDDSEDEDKADRKRKKDDDDDDRDRKTDDDRKRNHDDRKRRVADDRERDNDERIQRPRRAMLYMRRP